jgi:S1 RNA binding domain protein
MAAEVDALVDGKITGIMDYGAFVDIGEGKNGMVHISEVAASYVTNIRDFLAVGQQVRVKVLSISPEGKISLSIKKADQPAQPSAAAQSVSPAAAPKAPGERPPAQRPPRRGSSPNVWQGQRGGSGAQTFEDMMSQFKQTSEDKISTLRRSGDSRYGGGVSRRGGSGRK